MQWILSFLAGSLTTLSPCVLPILPIIVGSSLSKNKFGPIFLAIGMIFSFTLLGIIVATIGNSIGLSSSVIRTLSAVIFIISSLVFINSKADLLFKKITTPLAERMNGKAGDSENTGLLGMVFMGALLGGIWAPCSGPTLGLAMGLALQEGSRLLATSYFFVFGIGASIPLLLIAYGLKNILNKNRGNLLAFGQKSKKIMGFGLLLVGISVLFGLDKSLETLILNTLPESFIDFLTQF